MDFLLILSLLLAVGAVNLTVKTARKIFSWAFLL